MSVKSNVDICGEHKANKLGNVNVRKNKTYHKYKTTCDSSYFKLYLNSMKIQLINDFSNSNINQKKDELVFENDLSLMRKMDKSQKDNFIQIKPKLSRSLNPMQLNTNKQLNKLWFREF